MTRNKLHVFRVFEMVFFLENVIEITADLFVAKITSRAKINVNLKNDMSQVKLHLFSMHLISFKLKDTNKRY